MKFDAGVTRFFFDDSLISRQHRLVRRWLPAKIFPQPLIRPDRPWEGRILALYGTVLPLSGGGYRMYYSNLAVPKGKDREYSKVFVAESDDGFLWTKPDLNLVDWRGDSRNNIIIAPPHVLDAPSVVADPSGDIPYRLIAYEREGEAGGSEVQRGLFAYSSRDGLAFERSPKPFMVTGDRTNIVTQKEDGRFLVYTRHKDMMRLTGTRSVYRITSADFQEWTSPELVLKPDLVDEPEVEYYGMSVFRRHGWYLGLLEYWHSEIDCIETYLVFSRDGAKWNHPEPRRPFIAADHEWNRKWSSCASNGPVIMNEQMVFHFGGRWVSHHFDSAQQDGVIGFASLPLDRFCGLEGTTGGLVETIPIEWPGGDLVINADTRPFYDSHPAHCRGRISVEILDAEGAELADWSGDRSATFSGNTHSRGRVESGVIRWPDGRSLDKLKGIRMRLRFKLDWSRLFTFLAGKDD